MLLKEEYELFDNIENQFVNCLERYTRVKKPFYLIRNQTCKESYKNFTI